jgi:ribosomal protein S6--L-glutamate ligase
VVKPIYGSLGIGVERLRAHDPAARARLGQLLQLRHALYLQRYVAAAATLDVRAFVVGDTVRAAVSRRLAPGELAGNAARGARLQPLELDAATAELAVRATRALGLAYAGVDLMVGAAGPLVLEVNGTPSFRALFEATGRDMAGAIVEHAVEELTGSKWTQVQESNHAADYQAEKPRGREKAYG